MAKNADLRPTDRELDILRVLWDRGPSTVREVHETVSERGSTGYTTTLKLMQIMRDKGLLTRDDSARTHVYRAAAPENETQRRLLGDLLERAFNGSARKLMAALTATGISQEEISQIRNLLEELEEEGR